MKKIINKPSDFVDETIDGLIKSHPHIYALAKDNSRVITRAVKASNKVGLVTGGGSGHLPVFTGYVGKGLLDACAIGSVFASPSVDQIASAIRNANNGNGVLCILGNYGGDVMNFEMACEIVKDEGIQTKTVIVADDIASAKPEEKEKHKANNEKLAKSRIKLGLLLNEYGEKNNLKVTDDEVRAEIQKQIKGMPGQEKMVLDYYQKNPSASQSLKGSLYEENVQGCKHHRR